MNFTDYAFQANGGDVIEVTLDARANVRLLDEANFHRFKRGKRHKYYGGQATRSPVRLTVPRTGRWHAIIDLGGHAGRVRSSARLISAS